MVPAAVVDNRIADLLPHLEAEDILIDGGNSYYIDDLRAPRNSRRRASTTWTWARVVASGDWSAGTA